MKLSFKFLILAFIVSCNVIPLRCMEFGSKRDAGEWPLGDKLQNLVNVAHSLITEMEKLTLSCCACCLPDESLEPADESIFLLTEKHEHECCPLIRNKEIETLAQAINCNTPKTLCETIKKLTQGQSYDQALIVKAVQCALGNSGKSILMTGKYGYTALHWACLYSGEACVPVILAVADSTDDEKVTLQKLLVQGQKGDNDSLGIACFHNNPFDVLAILAAAGSINDEGATLHFLLKKGNGRACVYCRNACAQALLDAARSIQQDISEAISLDPACLKACKDNNCIDRIKESYRKLCLPVPEGL